MTEIEAPESGAVDGKLAIAHTRGMFDRRTRVGAYAVSQDPDGRILLCKFAAGFGLSGLWTLPGGGLEFGEDPAVGVLRELEEETGLNGKVQELLTVSSRMAVVNGRRGPYDLHSVRIVYRVEIVGGTLRYELNGSTECCGWFYPGEAQALPLVDLAEIGLETIRMQPMEAIR
jgi:8-oxo-dGTP pyrophosphatase MutT (NUDIX family)